MTIPDGRPTFGPPAAGDEVATPRRLTRKGQETRKRVLAAAAGLILKHGVTGTQIEDVRKAAGVSGSQMTHYFRDKHTLVQEVIAWQAENTLTDHRHPALGSLDSIQAWHRWAEMIVERQTGRGFQGGCEFGSLAGQLVESEPDLRPDLAALQGGLLLAQTLRRAAPPRDSLQAAVAHLETFVTESGRRTSSPRPE